nr:protease modulator HflC [bacterium]
MKTALGFIIAVLLMVVLLFVTGTVYTVKEGQQVIETQFGKPIGEPITDAGLHFKLPFIVKVNVVEKRVLAWDGDSAPMPTRDKTYIQVDTFARWQIADPLLYFKTLRDERSALSRLDDILGSETRNAVAKHDLLEVVRSTKD